MDLRLYNKCCGNQEPIHNKNLCDSLEMITEVFIIYSQYTLIVCRLIVFMTV